MNTSVVIDKRDKPLIKTSVSISPKDSILSVRRLSKLFRIRSEGFLTLFVISDSWYCNNLPLTVYGVVKALDLPTGSHNSVYYTIEGLCKKGLVEPISMGNVHKYYIPTDKALEQISPLLR